MTYRQRLLILLIHYTMNIQKESWYIPLQIGLIIEKKRKEIGENAKEPNIFFYKLIEPKRSLSYCTSM